jgi:hypothetical protein
MGIPTSRNPDTPEGLESRLSVGIIRIPVDLSHSTEPELSVEPKRILAEPPCSSCSKDSREAGKSSDP